MRAVPAALWRARPFETEIALSDAGVTAGAGVEVDGGDIAITQGGSYRVTGAMSEGCILVDADDVEIVWDGAQLSSSTAAPLTRAATCF